MSLPEELHGTCCLVTGGAGFIGSHLTEALLAVGARVRVLDDMSAGRPEYVPAEADLVAASITDPAACRQACAGAQYVFHHAARVSVVESIQDPVGTHLVNALGTLNLLVAAREAGCRRVVYAGSASAYGRSQVTPQHEDLPPDPRSPYAASKHAGEVSCRLFTDLYGLETVVLRYFNVFGPRQDPASPYAGVIARFIGLLLRGENLTIEGDGEQTRDFVPVENVIQANLRAALAPGAAGRTFNIGVGEAMSVGHLARLLLELSQAPSGIIHVAPRPGDIRHSQADISRAREVLGYEVAVPPREGLARTLAWYQEQARAEP